MFFYHTYRIARIRAFLAMPKSSTKLPNVMHYVNWNVNWAIWFKRRRRRRKMDSRKRWKVSRRFLDGFCRKMVRRLSGIELRSCRRALSKNTVAWRRQQVTKKSAQCWISSWSLSSTVAWELRWVVTDPKVWFQSEATWPSWILLYSRLRWDLKLLRYI